MKATTKKSFSSSLISLDSISSISMYFIPCSNYDLFPWMLFPPFFPYRFIVTFLKSNLLLMLPCLLYVFVKNMRSTRQSLRSPENICQFFYRFKEISSQLNALWLSCATDWDVPAAQWTFCSIPNLCFLATEDKLGCLMCNCGINFLLLCYSATVLGLLSVRKKG